MSSHSAVFVLVVPALLGLASCTTLAMEAMNGTTACPPGVLREVIININTINGLTPGATVDDLASAGPPDHQSGATLYYRTASKLCRSLPAAQEFTPITVAPNGRILKVGGALGQSAAL